MNNEQREIFIKWLKNEISSNEDLLRQMEKLNIVKDWKKQEIDACKVVLKILESIHDH